MVENDDGSSQALAYKDEVAPLLLQLAQQQSKQNTFNAQLLLQIAQMKEAD